MSTPEQQIIAKLHYMGRQYGNGQMARGGPSGKHYLTEAAEMLESLIAERAALSRQVAVAWGLTATETKRTDMDKPTPPESRFAPGQECEHGQLARSCGLCDRDYEIAELRAQVAQYKEDAERYRWLRDTNLDAGVRATGEHLEPLQVPMIFIGHPEDQWTLGSFASAWVGEKFDRAIDAAIDKARKTT